MAWVAGVPRVAVAIVVAFVALRLLAFVPHHDAVLYYDSGEYRALDGGPDLPYVSLTGHAVRPWTVPLFYALLGDDQRRVWAQLLVSIVAWVVAAGVLAAALQHRRAQLATLVTVLLIGCSVSVASWDLLILSESLALSLAVLTMATWVRFTTRPTWAAATAAVTVTTLFMFTRIQTLPLVGAVALLVIAWAIVSCRKPNEVRESLLVKLAVAAGLAIVVVWGSVVNSNVELTASTRPEGVGLFSQNFVMTLQSRILTDPEVLEWFRAYGMPEPTGLGPPSPDDGGFPNVLSTFAANRPLVEWVRVDGSRALITHAVLHPEKFPLEFGKKLPSLLVPPRDQLLYTDTPSVLPSMVEDVLSPTSRPTKTDGSHSGGGFPHAVLLAGALLCLFLPGRRRDHRLLTVTCLVFVMSWVAFFLSWLVTPMEPVRHAIPFTMLILLSMVVFCLANIDAALGRSVDDGPETALVGPADRVSGDGG